MMENNLISNDSIKELADHIDIAVKQYRGMESLGNDISSDGFLQLMHDIAKHYNIAVGIIYQAFAYHQSGEDMVALIVGRIIDNDDNINSMDDIRYGKHWRIAQS